ncbi:hypothetical protein GF406_18785 [candidate division KSB1 bacterium]|jgi:polysaccharide deacetylase 2 family uncharacterized protein YibQ|nr:hypothetical protein [candidate division KSB1 bacterium]
MKRTRRKKISIIYRLFLQSKTIKIALSISALSLGIMNYLVYSEHRNEPAAEQEITPDATVMEVINDLLYDYHIQKKYIQIKDHQIKVIIPSRFRFVSFYRSLQQDLQSIDADIQSCKERVREKNITIRIRRHQKPALELVLNKRSSLSEVVGSVAIIVDDFGYVYNETVREFIFFPHPITISILPGLKETEKISREAGLAEKEILLHLPMEPQDAEFDDHGYTITTRLDAASIRLRVKAALAQVPNARGVNNHQGSLATRDKNIMTQVMNVLADEKKYFIDSRTSPSSVALDVAKSQHIPAAANQVFLDAKDEKQFIRDQIKRLARMAARDGQAIGIAHVRSSTLKVLAEELPSYTAKGIEFVFASQLLE